MQRLQFLSVMPQRSEFIREVVGKLEDFVALFLLPLFFAYTGLRTRMGLIGGDPKLWLLRWAGAVGSDMTYGSLPVNC